MSGSCSRRPGPHRSLGIALAEIGNAKGELYAGLDRDRAIAIVNVDDPEVMRVAGASGCPRIRTFGASAGADVRLGHCVAIDERSQHITLSIDGRSVELHCLSLAGTMR